MGDLSGLEAFVVDEKVSRDKWLRLLSNLIQALGLRHTNAHPLEPDPDDLAEADIAREKLCLEKITSKYQKIVGKWEQLEQLSFDDPQLKEATKTFLYGFFRASAVLCAASVETQLRRICQSDEMNTRQLIDNASKRGCLQRDLADVARDLFALR